MSTATSKQKQIRPASHWSSKSPPRQAPPQNPGGTKTGPTLRRNGIGSYSGLKLFLPPPPPYIRHRLLLFLRLWMRHRQIPEIIPFCPRQIMQLSLTDPPTGIQHLRVPEQIVRRIIV